jgi:hypothetical protein
MSDRRRARRRPHFDRLDGRCLPSAGVTANVSRGILAVTGTDGADAIGVDLWSVPVRGARGAPKGVVVVQGVGQFPLSKVHAIAVWGLAGDDVITVNQVGPARLPVLISAGAGDDVVQAAGPGVAIDGGPGRDLINGIWDQTQLVSALSVTAPGTPAPPKTTPAPAPNPVQAPVPALSVAPADPATTVPLLPDSVVASHAVPGAVTGKILGTLSPDGPDVYPPSPADPGGNTGPTGTTTPPAPGPPDLEPGSDTGASNTDNITSDTRPIFDVQAADSAATVQLLRNGVVVGTRTGPGAVADATLAAQSSPAGTYSYTARQVDAAGHVSPASPALSVTIVTSQAVPPAPGLPVLDAGSSLGTSAIDSNPADSRSWTSSTTPVFDVAAAQPGALVQLLRKPLGAPDSAYAVVGSRSGPGAITDATLAAQSPPDGTYAYAAQQRNAAGDPGPIGPAATVTVDTTPTAPAGSALLGADIRDYGAVPGPAGAEATAAAIQAALDSGKPYVWIPADPAGWWISRPVFMDLPNSRLVGEPGATLNVSSDTDMGVVVGIHRAGLTPDHIVSADGYLDPSAQGHWAIDLKGDTHFAQQLGNITGEPGVWSGPGITVDLAADLTNAAGSACLLGWGAGTPGPMNAWYQPDLHRIWVRFRTSDGAQHDFGVPIATPGFHRISWEIHADTAQVLTWVDRQQVAPLDTDPGPNSLANWRPDPSRTLAGNGGAPFTIGALDDVSPGDVTNYFGNALDAVIAGLRIGTEGLYRNDGPGTSQRYLAANSKIATQPLDDATQFFNLAAGSVALLPLDQPPAAVAADRLIRVLGRDGTAAADGYGLLLSNGPNDLTTAIGGVTIEDLSIVAHNPVSSAVAVGPVVGLTIRDSDLIGGAFGIGSWDMGGGWVTRIQDSRFGGGRSGLRLNSHIVQIRNSEALGGDIAAVDLPAASGDIDQLAVVGGGAPADVIRGSGYLNLGQLSVDYQAGTSPSRAIIDWTSIGGNPQTCFLRWQSIVSGPIGPGAVVVDLHSPPGANAAELVAGGVDVAGGSFAAVVRSDGPVWQSAVPLAFPAGVPAGVPALVYTGAGPSPLVTAPAGTTSSPASPAPAPEPVGTTPSTTSPTATTAFAIDTTPPPNAALLGADIRDYGAVPGPNGAEATTAAIQAALDSGKPYVWIPADPAGWWIDRPIFMDRPGVKLVGEPGATLQVSPDTDMGVVVGIPRAGLTPDHIVPADNVLDASAQGRFGINLEGDTHFVQQWGNINGAPGRWTTPVIAVDFAVDLSRAGAGAAVLGWGSDVPEPLNIVNQAGSLLVRFRTSDGVIRSFHVPYTGGFHRFSIQIDTAAATVLTWVDRVQVTPPDLPSWRPDPSRTLAGNDGAPFGIGALDDVGPPGASGGFGALDATIYGLRIGTSPIYANGGAGSAQHYLPNAIQWWQQPLNDLNQFFNYATGSWFFLPMTGAPDAVAADRLIRVAGTEPYAGWSNNNGYGLLLPNDAAAGAATVGVQIEGLNIYSYSPYGSAVTLGSVDDLLVRDCEIVGGDFAIGSWDLGVGSSARIQDVRFRGGRSAVRLDGFTVQILDCESQAANVACLDLPDCTADIDRLYAVGGGTPDYIIRGSGGLNLGHLTIDYESAQSPARAVVDWSSAGSAVAANFLRWDFIDTGTLGPDAVVVDLHDAPGGGGTAELDAGSVDIIGGPYGPYPAIVRCDGTSWRSNTPIRFPVGAPAGTPTFVYTGPDNSSLTD